MSQRAASTATNTAAKALREPLTRPAVIKQIKLQRKQRRQPPIHNWRIHTGDTVQIISGKSKGYVGTVKQILTEINSIIVTGAKMTKRTAKRTELQTGYTYTAEAPIHISNVQLVDPQTKQATRIYTAYKEDGTQVRVSKKSNAVIPIPEKENDTVQLVNTYTDTPKDIVLERTYVMPDYKLLASRPFSELSEDEKFELAFARMDV